MLTPDAIYYNWSNAHHWDRKWGMAFFNFRFYHNPSPPHPSKYQSWMIRHGFWQHNSDQLCVRGREVAVSPNLFSHLYFHDCGCRHVGWCNYKVAIYYLLPYLKNLTTENVVQRNTYFAHYPSGSVDIVEWHWSKCTSWSSRSYSGVLGKVEL